MITLHTFGPMWDLPDPSPFVVKAQVLLKMSGVPHVVKASGLKGAPKGKLPYIDDDGVKIADSTFIRLHLEQKHGVDFDRHLTRSERASAWALDKLLEDHVYWALLYERWIVDENFRIGPAHFFSAVPAPIRPLVTSMVRRQVRGNLRAHGLGRHSREEIVTLGKRGFDALAHALDDRAFLFGDGPSSADATAFAFVVNILCPRFDTPLRTHAESHANLVAYSARMHEKFFG